LSHTQPAVRRIAAAISESQGRSPVTTVAIGPPAGLDVTGRFVEPGPQYRHIHQRWRLIEDRKLVLRGVGLQRRLLFQARRRLALGSRLG
jgi:hypothetical protein